MVDSVRTTPLPVAAWSTPGTIGGVAAATADSVNPLRDRSPGHATVVSVTATTSGVTPPGPLGWPRPRWRGRCSTSHQDQDKDQLHIRAVPPRPRSYRLLVPTRPTRQGDDDQGRRPGASCVHTRALRHRSSTVIDTSAAPAPATKRWPRRSALRAVEQLERLRLAVVALATHPSSASSASSSSRSASADRDLDLGRRPGRRPPPTPAPPLVFVAGQSWTRPASRSTRHSEESPGLAIRSRPGAESSATSRSRLTGGTARTYCTPLATSSSTGAKPRPDARSATTSSIDVSRSAGGAFSTSPHSSVSVAQHGVGKSAVGRLAAPACGSARAAADCARTNAGSGLADPRSRGSVAPRPDPCRPPTPTGCASASVVTTAKAGWRHEKVARCSRLTAAARASCYRDQARSDCQHQYRATPHRHRRGPCIGCHGNRLEHQRPHQTECRGPSGRLERIRHPLSPEDRARAPPRQGRARTTRERTTIRPGRRRSPATGPRCRRPTPLPVRAIGRWGRSPPPATTAAARGAGRLPWPQPSVALSATAPKAPAQRPWPRAEGAGGAPAPASRRAAERRRRLPGRMRQPFRIRQRVRSRRRPAAPRHRRARSSSDLGQWRPETPG